MARFSLLISTFILLLSPAVLATTFSLVSKCEYTVWPGILANAGEPPLSTTGFALQKGESRTISAPTGWGGRFWGRTHCTMDDSAGKFSCITGDCGSGKVECSGSGATPPATLAEFKLDGSGGFDFFDVSLVDGYNLPILVAPQGGSGQNCTSAGCIADLNSACPSDLRVTNADQSKSVACRSACDAFQQPQYCCSGAYNSPQTCKPSSYSKVFKSACPSAYSYAYDDGSSTFTCANAEAYVITFCPSPNTSKKSSSDESSASSSSSTPPSLINSTMVYEGAADYNIASPSTHIRTTSAHVLSTSVSFAVALWQLPWN